jgi:aminoacrylate peracid reductase
MRAVVPFAVSCLLVSLQPAPPPQRAGAREIVMSRPAPVGPYSPAVKAGGFIYVSGTLAQDEAGTIVGKDAGAQTTVVIERMRDILVSAGSSLEQVVAVSVYLKSTADFAAMNDAYRRFWPKDPPTRTTIQADLVLPEALVELSMTAVPDGAERVVVHPAGWMTSPNPYSYGIKSGDTLFLSGLVARNGRDNAFVPGDAASQTKTIMENARELLKAAGMSFDDVVSARVFMPDVSGFQQMNEAYRSYFTAGPPARATVKAALAGPQAAVEITFVASSAPREIVSDGRPANPNLSAAVRSGEHVYLSGMLGNTPETQGDAGAQTRETLNRIHTALKAAGCSPGDVADSLVYLTDLKDFAAMNEAYHPFFGRDFPARATVRAGLVAPDGLVEIMMTAVCRKS